MKAIKKVLSAVLALCLIMSLGLIGASADTSNTLKLTVDGFADGQQVSVVCMAPGWNGVQWYNDNENLIYVDQLTAKNGSVDIKVDVENPVKGEYYIIVNGEIYRQALISGPTQAVTSDKDIYLVNEEITLTVTTGADIEKLGVFNEAGKGISRLSTKFVESDDAKIWTVVIKIGTKGDRTISVKGLKADEAFADVEALGTAGFAVVKEIPPAAEEVAPAIIEVNAPEAAKAKQPFTFTVKTSKAVVNLGLFNESGAGISTSKSYVDKDDARIWTVSTNVSSRGDRILTVKMAAEDSNWLENGTSFNIKLTK